MEKNFFEHSIGILGGGQLARMLVEQGSKLGFKMSVFCQSRIEPAALVTPNLTIGEFNDEVALKKFLRQNDVNTFESEFLNAELLTQLCLNDNVKILPKPQSMQIIQDRLSQKKMLLENKINTSHFVKVDHNSRWQEVSKELGKQMVLKKRRFGYDGYGTFYCRSEEEFKKILVNAQPEDFIAEAFVKFKRELSLIGVRNSSGDFVTLPLVETKQKNSKCFWVKGPTQTKSVKNLALQIKKLLKKIDYVGVIAFELFETSNDLLVNEVAPRVHNTGHHSLTSMTYDQFTYHNLAILNFRLPKTELRTKGFAMANIIGSSTSAPKIKKTTADPYFWYGKADNKPGRKMGHINTVAATPELALKKALATLKEFKV